MISVEEFLEQQKDKHVINNAEVKNELRIMASTNNNDSVLGVKAEHNKSGQVADNTGAKNKSHPRIESKARIELLAKVLGISEGAVSSRLSRLGGNDVENCAKLITESSYWITS